MVCRERLQEACNEILITQWEYHVDCGRECVIVQLLAYTFTSHQSVSPFTCSVYSPVLPPCLPPPKLFLHPPSIFFYLSFRPPPLFFRLCIPHSPSLPPSLPPSVPPLSLSLPPSLPPSLPLSLSPSLPPSLPLSLSLCVQNSYLGHHLVDDECLSLNTVAENLI